MSAKKNLLRRPAALHLLRDKSGGAATTVTLAAVAGATTFDVASATGIAANKRFRIDDGENVESVEIQGVAGTTVTVKKPLLKAHAAGFAVVEQTPYDLGDFEQTVTPTQTTEQTDVLAATRRLKFTTIQGYQQATLEGNLLGQTLENIAVALGLSFASVTGTGADVDDPKVLQTDFSDVDSENNVCLILKYTNQDGTTRVREFWGCAVDYSGYTINMALGQTGSIPVKFNVYSAIVDGDYTPAYTVDASKKASKGKVFGELSAVGIWAAAGGDTTVATAAPAAGDSTVDVADASGLAAGEYIAIGADDTLEINYIPTGGITSNTLTLAWPLLHAHAIGEAVQKVTQTTFAAVGKDGVKLNVGGSTTPIQSGLRRLPIGMQPGNVDATMQLSLLERTSAAYAYARGIPQANIANNRVLLSEDLASATILGAFAKGVLKDGTICLVNILAPAQDVATVTEQFGADPNAATSPFNVKPSSGVQFVQYAA